MIEIAERTATYDVKTTQKPIYQFCADYRKTLAAQNASVKLFYSEEELLDIQDVDGAVSGEWNFWMPDVIFIRARPRAMKPAVNRISLVEAQNIAVRALLKAERLRQEARDREATFWAKLDEEG